jgi:glutaconate CoA-transferase subunit A
MTIATRELDFRSARQRLEAKAKSAGPKLTTLDDAAGRVKDGDSVAIGGCLISRTPLGLMRALLRRRPHGLTIARNLMCYEGEWCLVADAVEKIVTSWMGIGLPWGLSKIVREYVESGRVVFEEWSHLGLGLRFRAGAMGLPFLPSLTMLGSGLMDVGGSRTITCPYTGEMLHAVPALFPDVALLHVQRADRFGNCQIDGYTHMDPDIASAATTVLVQAEEIVDEDRIKRQPDRTVIPGFVVDAVVEAPFGAFPGECYGLYETDFAHYDGYAAAQAENPLDGVRAYLDQYVYGPATQEAYLALFGPETLARQQAAARELVGGESA